MLVSLRPVRPLHGLEAQVTPTPLRDVVATARDAARLPGGRPEVEDVPR